MKKKLALTITSIILWIAVIVPTFMTLKDCFRSYFSGTTHGFNGDRVIYGIPAFWDTLGATIAFAFPQFVILGMAFLAALILTAFTVIAYFLL